MDPEVREVFPAEVLQTGEGTELVGEHGLGGDTVFLFSVLLLGCPPGLRVRVGANRLGDDLQRGFLEDIRVEQIGVSLPSDQRSLGAVVEGGLARFGAGWKPNWNVAVDAAIGGSGEGGTLHHLAVLGLWTRSPSFWGNVDEILLQPLVGGGCLLEPRPLSEDLGRVLVREKGMDEIFLGLAEIHLVASLANQFVAGEKAPLACHRSHQRLRLGHGEHVENPLQVQATVGDGLAQSVQVDVGDVSLVPLEYHHAS